MNGLCECGCGQATKLSQVNCATRNLVRNKPLRFINGHNAKASNHYRWRNGRSQVGAASGGKYEGVNIGPHPRANKRGYVPVHILLAEKALGKPLPPNAIVHHVDETPSHNVNNNLVICQDRDYHNLIHRRMRALRICGHANWLWCSGCKQYDALENLVVRQYLNKGRWENMARHRLHTKETK